MTHDRFAFALSRARIGADRFELSFWDPLPVVTACMILVQVLSVGWIPLAIALPIACASLSFRISLVVTRDTSRVTWTVLGIAWKQRRIGHRPRLTNLGWDYNEIAVCPAAGPDVDDVALVAWCETNERKNAEAEQLVALATSQIARLHGERASHG